ncbi:MAG: hypothetical protein COA99_08105 [Moraxellaceae bacterium]|nr:MAG: hypothetical protein COA99_08105 [Moraxellaceae bacterium]
MHVVTNTFRHITSKRCLTFALLIMIFSSASCGYVLHPKRVGQTSGDIDPAILALDAAGLLFGIIPGIVAFAVDFTTGAIYLAPGERSVIDKHRDHHKSSATFSPHLMNKTPITSTEEIILHIDREIIAETLSLYTNTQVDSNSIRFHKPAKHTTTISAYRLHLTTNKS